MALVKLKLLKDTENYDLYCRAIVPIFLSNEQTNKQFGNVMFMSQSFCRHETIL